jgi:hypothetical protein
MQVSHASPGEGAEGDEAQADLAQALAQPPVVPQAHCRRAFANV